MQLDKVNSGRLCVPGPLGTHPLQIPNVVIPPGSADIYSSYTGLSSLAGLQSGSTVVGMNPDSPFALFCVPGNVNAFIENITAHRGFFASRGATMFLGEKCFSNTALNSFNGTLNKTTGRTSLVNSATLKLDARIGNLTGGIWTYKGIQLETIAHGHSDARIKRSIIPIEGALDKITQLNGISFRWGRDYVKKTQRDKELKTKVVTRSIGFIAQDVEKVVPEVVSTDKIDGIDFDIKKVDYEKMVALLTEAIKEQQTQIESLKSEVQELKSQLNN
jgi:hypothetical protein